MLTIPLFARTFYFNPIMDFNSQVFDAPLICCNFKRSTMAKYSRIIGYK